MTDRIALAQVAAAFLVAEGDQMTYPEAVPVDYLQYDQGCLVRKAASPEFYILLTYSREGSSDFLVVIEENAIRDAWYADDAIGPSGTRDVIGAAGVLGAHLMESLNYERFREDSRLVISEIDY